MYEKEFEEGLSRLSPEIAARAMEMHRHAILEGEIEGLILKSCSEEGEEILKKKQEMIDMLDRAVEDSKDD